MAASAVAELLSTPAFVFLAEQVACGALPEARAEAYKLRFAELYKASIASAEREKDSTQKTRELKAMVRDESIAVEKARIRRDQVEAASNAAEAERKRLTTSLTELEARAVSLQQEGNELRLREQELSEDVAKLKADNESAVTPVLTALSQDIADSKAEAARAASQAEALLASKRELTSRLADLEKAVGNAHSTAGALRTEFSRVKDEPGRAAKAFESVRRATQGVNEETERLHTALSAREAEMKEQEAAAEELRRVKDELEVKLARYRDELSGREDEVGRVEATLKAERSQYKDLLERRIELQTEDASAQATARVAENERDAASAAYERAKRELKRKQDLASAAAAAIPPLEALVVERQLEVSRLGKEAREAEVAQGAFRRDIDQLVASLLKEEGLEKRQREQLLELAESCKAVEAEKDQWHKEELLAVKQVAALKAQRDNKSREVTRLEESRRATIETSKMKELHLIDLTKQLADINGRLRQFAAMYEVVKTERNAFANSIQAASQSIAEMRERIKILHNEVDILKNESTAKDKALAKERQAHALASVQRDALRAEANKASVVYREKQSAVESQIMAIDKMNSIINNLEREMLALKKQYEAAVETRNYTGIQLIDRNDELCILYEKSNIHDKTLADGEKALRVMAEEIRSLKIIIGEHERQLHVSGGSRKTTATRPLSIPGAHSSRFDTRECGLVCGGAANSFASACSILSVCGRALDAALCAAVVGLVLCDNIIRFPVHTLFARFPTAACADALPRDSHVG